MGKGAISLGALENDSIVCFLLFDHIGVCSLSVQSWFVMARHAEDNVAKHTRDPSYLEIGLELDLFTR